MPIWLYDLPHLTSALIMVLFVETVAMIGLMLVRRFLIPRLHYHDGANDAVSGTVQAIGVFYGITVGLIAVGVWNTNSNASDLVFLCELGPPNYAITDGRGEELSDRWQEALELKRIAHELWGELSTRA